MSATFLQTKNKGTTLVEAIIYAAILVFIVGLIVQTFVSIGSVYRRVKVTRELESSGTIAMDRMLREIRNASNVVQVESVLGSNPGVLTISGTDDSSNLYKLSFDVSSGILQISKNGGSKSPLTSSATSVNFLKFTRISSSKSEAVRIELEMSGSLGGALKTEKFYGFAVLRSSY